MTSRLLQVNLAERDRQLKDKDTAIKDRDAALRKSQNSPRPQDSQKLDELRKLLKEKDMEINRFVHSYWPRFNP